MKVTYTIRFEAQVMNAEDAADSDVEYFLEDYEEQLAKAVNGFIEQSGFADYPLILEGSISVDHELIEPGS